MKAHTVFSILIIGSLTTLPIFAGAQDRDNMSRSEISKMDSVESASAREDQLQKTNDESRMAEAKLDRKQTKAKSKDAKRVEKEASDAAKQSRMEVRAEKRAQKSRKEASRQSKRASEAREKSEKN